MACLRALTQAALTHAVDAMLIVGDMFDKTALHTCAVADILSPLQMAGIPVIAVEGNHDCRHAFTTGPTPLEQLHAAGSLLLLRPDGLYDGYGAALSLSSYQAKGGSILMVKGIRIVGLGYLGAATHERLLALLYALPHYEGATLCMLHSGVYPDESKELPAGGMRPQDMFALSDKVDYVALGHRHAREEGAFWFSPGSPNGARLKNPKEDRGYYIVDLEKHACTNRFLSTRDLFPAL